jgi:DNA-binding MarR family transcriptional regulator
MMAVGGIYATFQGMHKKPSVRQILRKWKSHHQAKMIAIIIRDHSDPQGWAVIGQTEIGESATGMDRRTINKAIKELIKEGHVEENPCKNKRKKLLRLHNNKLD